MFFPHSLPYQLAIAGIPEVGAKSRVETQVKMYLRLTRNQGAPPADPPYSSIKLPPHLLVGERFLPKKGSQSSNSQLKNPLTLEVSIVLNSNIDQQVFRCSSCSQRERKLWSKRNEKSGGGFDPQFDSLPNDENDQEKIIIFHSMPYVDLINDEALLRARITCYCRHHEEKTGFRIFFQLKNSRDELVAQGMSPPIMITDDHKPSRKLMKLANSQEEDSDTNDSDDPLPPKKRLAALQKIPPENGEPEIVRPPAPLPNLMIAEPATTPSRVLENRPSYPTPGPFPFPSQISAFSPPVASPPSQSPLPLSDAQLLSKFSQGHLPSFPLLHPPGLTSLGSPLSDSPFGMRPLMHSARSVQDSPSPRSWGSENRRAPELRVTKVLPREGRLEGGMEVIVLGSGFYDGLVCYFGNQKATASFYWSPGALLCILPPSEKGYPETVPIFLGPPPAPWKELACNDMTMFTYIDTSPAEKAMNIIADQLSNGGMTGKEMAKDIVSGEDTAIRKFLDYHSRAKTLKHFVN